MPISTYSPSHTWISLAASILFALLTWYFYIVPQQNKQLEDANKEPKKVEEKTKQVKKEPLRAPDFEKMFQEIKETSSLLVNWAVAILGATLYLLTIHKAGMMPYYLMFLPTSWVLTYYSLWHFWSLRARMTYQIFNQDFFSLSSMQSFTCSLIFF